MLENKLTTTTREKKLREKKKINKDDVVRGKKVNV